MTPELWSVVALSLRVSLVAMVITLPLAVAVGYALARFQFRGWHLVNGLAHLPLVLPPVVTGYILLILFGRNGALGAWLFDTFGIVLAFRWTGAALAAGVMAFPLMARAIRLAVDAVDPKLEEAAATLGASRLRIFVTITLPLIVPGVLAAAVLGFAKAIGEFGATITFVAAIPGETLTIPSAIYAELQIPGDSPAVITLVGLSVALAFGALVVSEALARRVRRGQQ